MEIPRFMLRPGKQAMYQSQRGFLMPNSTRLQRETEEPRDCIMRV